MPTKLEEAVVIGLLEVMPITQGVVEVRLNHKIERVIEVRLNRKIGLVTAQDLGTPGDVMETIVRNLQQEEIYQKVKMIDRVPSLPIREAPEIDPEV